MRPRLLRHPLGGGYDPATVFTAWEGDAFWLDSGADGVSYLGTGERIALPSPVLPGLRAARVGALGLVGWLGYELRAETTGVPVTRVSRYPDAAWLRVEQAVAVHPDGRAEVLALSPVGADQLAALRERMAAPPIGRGAAGGAPTSVEWHDDDAHYLESIRECQRLIREGEAYQLCLTTEASLEGRWDALEVYRRLRASSPTHHGALLRIGDVALLSSTPERFLEVDAEGVVTTRPIKGTRRRDPDPARDDELRAELLSSEKERAENLMIVDLMRNDLARVCEVGSVEVTSLLAVESYAQVHQLVSAVRGRLTPGLDAIDAIVACFPAGSMTGAPKLRATELLDGLEQRARGLYAGAFGYLAFDGSADLAMTIRSIVLDGTGATVGAGGGITALSVPEEELAEVTLKAAALLAALGEHGARDRG